MAFRGARLEAQMRIGYAVKVLSMAPARIANWLYNTFGIWYRPSLMQEDIRRHAGEAYAAGRAKFVRGTFKPSRNIMGERESQMNTRYWYRYKLEWKDPITGEIKTSFREVSTNEHLTRNDADAAYDTLYGRGGTKYSVAATLDQAEEDVSVTLDSVYHHAGWDY